MEKITEKITVSVINLDSQQFKKFELSKNIGSDKPTKYTTSEDALAHSLANKIFGFPWVSSIEVGQNYLIIEKQEWVDWEVLSGPLCGVIEDHYEYENSKPTATETAPTKTWEDPLSQRIQSVFDLEINPNVAEHGGHIELKKVIIPKIFIQLHGGCQGCSSSTATLKEGVNKIIYSQFSEITEVIDVTNHTDGENPYYT